MTPSTLLFDLDGTLVDSVADLATGVNLLREELDLPPLDLPTVRLFVGDGATALVTRSLPEGWFTPLRLQRFLELYGEHLLDRTGLYPGIREFLDGHRGSPMGVVTNKPFALTMDLLAGLGLLSYFPVIVGGDSGPTKKPDPAPVLHALRELGSAPHEAVLVGDHHTDLRAGLAAGVRTCFCAWGIGRDGGVPYDFRAEIPADLLRLFAPGVGVQGRPLEKKHPCPDCRHCQWCSDDRCRLCLRSGKGCRKKLSMAEQIALYEKLNAAACPPKSDS